MFAQSTDVDLNVLIGKWKLDMSPQDKTDSNFAMMNITKIEDSTFEGEFYRQGVKITNAQINTQLGVIYGALVSGDNSGIYNTTFYYKDGMLQGSTHSIDKKFLSVPKEILTLTMETHQKYFPIFNDKTRYC